MDFNEKLQQLRKDKGLTQEQLAAMLYVSRTAISKWESGKGYPGIESLKAISKVFAVSIDDLLSGEELISLSENENRTNINKTCSLIFGIVDLMALTFLILPLYGQSDGDFIRMVNIFALQATSQITSAIFIGLPILMAVMGVIQIIIQHYDNNQWLKISKLCSILLHIFTISALIGTRHPYATELMFVFFMVKLVLLVKSSQVR